MTSNPYHFIYNIYFINLRITIVYTFLIFHFKLFLLLMLLFMFDCIKKTIFKGNGENLFYFINYHIIMIKVS